MSPAVFSAALYASLALCVLGLFWRASFWLRIGIGPDAREIRPSQRLVTVFRGLASMLASRRVLPVLGA